MRVLQEHLLHPPLESRAQLRGQFVVRRVVDVTIKPSRLVDTAHRSRGHTQLELGS